MNQAGSAAWFAQHESRLVWRDWLSMITAGRRERLRVVTIGIVVFFLFMHFVAYWVVGPHADAAIDKQTLLTITTSALLSWMLMISQAMESITRAFYARSDLDLILASPVDSNKLFGVRIVTIALGTTLMALPVAAPFIDVLIARGGWRWLGAYGLIVAMGAAATALAVGLTVALLRMLGARLTRFVAQVVAAIIGAAFVIGLQVVAILSYGTISRAALLQSKTLLALAPGLDSALCWPARAALGELQPLAVVLATSFVLLAAAVAFVAPRFGSYAITAAGVGNASVVRSRRNAFGKRLSPRGALRRKEWILLRRDPWLMSQTLMQMLYLVPPALMLWRGFGEGNGALQLVVPVLVMARRDSLPAASPGWRSPVKTRPTSSPPLRCLPVSSCGPRSRLCSARSPSSLHPWLRRSPFPRLGTHSSLQPELASQPRHRRRCSSGFAARPSAASSAAARCRRGSPPSRRHFLRSGGPQPRRSPQPALNSPSHRPCLRCWCSAEPTC